MIDTLRATAMAALRAVLPAGGLYWSLTQSRRSIVFAFALNWALMGLAFVSGMVMPLRFGGRYYEVFPFERRGAIYDRLGVRRFQDFLRRSRFHGPAPWPHYSRAGGRAQLIEDTKNPETAHAAIFVIVTVVAIDAARRGWWETAIALMTFNIALNAYPVFSMRHIRARARPVRD